jgi:hypothetical protein
VRRLRLLPKSSRPRRRSGGHAGVVLTPRQLAPHVALSGPFACVQTADDCIAAQVLDVDSLGEAVIERSLYTPPFVCAAAASIIGTVCHLIEMKRLESWTRVNREGRTSQ